ncbi:MAG TPA: SDR family oxidoreductase [Tepidisphaeraceae bacterium]|jgi:NAD(P)-dependent dehydrogenase (short-subunit alcohol dehydrogenase family)|nr:SDR family oxidoreductase [Tepidisphaeraceae bacterium]
MAKVAVVTGAGSGVGQAIAKQLAALGWSVALIGRHEKTLNETINLSPEGADRMRAFSCDVGDASAVKKMARDALAAFGTVDVLVNSAGTNVAKRALADLSEEDFDHVVKVNLNGAFYCVHEFLPTMRAKKSGTIVNIVSDAGLRSNKVSGIAYIASKFGLTGLTDTINVEERANGIRATAIFPGEINTPLLDRRPAPPPVEARQKMLQPEDVAAAALLAITLPPRAIVEHLVLRPA